MAQLITVTDEGVTTLSLTEAESYVRDLLARVYGQDISVAPQTPQGQLAGLIAVLAVEMSEAVAALANSWSVERASGAQLRDLGSLLDIFPAAAARSEVIVQLTGVAGTVVPAGSLMSTTGDPPTRWETVSAATLGDDPVEVTAQATVDGPVTAAAAAVSRIVTRVAGWETVTNPAAAVPGRLAESDARFRERLQARTGRASTGPLAALEAALTEAQDGKVEVFENATSRPVVTGNWPLSAHSVLAVVEDGLDATLRRAVETHRGLGTATMTAIRGGPPDSDDLAGMTAGSLSWDGTTYTGIDLSSASTGAARAAALTAAITSGDVTIRWIGGRFVAVYEWQPDNTPVFGGDADAFGLDAASATASPGPFVRTRDVALAVAVSFTRTAGFPADGLQQVRRLMRDVVDAYAPGQTLWANDLLAVAQSVAGAQITSLTVTAGGADVSGQVADLDTVWTLAESDITATVS